MRLLLRIALGVDTSTALLLYPLLSLVFDVPFNIFILLSAIIVAHCPDIDMIPFVIYKRGAKENCSKAMLAAAIIVDGIWSNLFWINKSGLQQYQNESHWPYGHYPLIWIPTGILASWFAAIRFHLPPAYLILLTLGLMVWHFYHDMSDKPRGFPWLAPFSWTHFQQSGLRIWRVDTKIVYANYGKQKNRIQQGQGEVATRVALIGWKSIMYFLISTTVLLRFMLHTRQ